MTREEQINKEAYRQQELVNIDAESFIEGAMWADKHPKSQWVSVEDDLPCNHEELIYYHNNNARTINVLVCYKGNIYGIEYMFNSTKMEWNWSDSTPCYWMPIPKPPKK